MLHAESIHHINKQFICRVTKTSIEIIVLQTIANDQTSLW